METSIETPAAEEDAESHRPAVESERILRKLEAAKDRYTGEVGSGGAMELVTLKAHLEVLRTAVAQHRGDPMIQSIATVAFVVRGRLCTMLSGVPSVYPNGAFDWLHPSCENLLFSDALDLALELTTARARDELQEQEALRAAVNAGEREREETARYLHKARVQAARDARWKHLSPVGAAAFRLAAKHPAGVIGEVARALISVEAEHRRGEVELPEDLDTLLWRLTADRLTAEERQLVGLPPR